MMLLPIIIPSIVYAGGPYRYFAWLDLHDSVWGVAIAHGVTGIPDVVITVSTALAAFDPRLEQAARGMDANLVQTLHWVILPRIAPGIVSGAIFASHDVFTLLRRIWDGINENLDPTMAAVVVQMVVFTLLLLLADMALRDEGVKVVVLKRVAPGRHKPIYTRDSCIAIQGGAIVTRTGPRIRRGEEAPVTETLGALGMPVLRTIHGTVLMEGDSFAYKSPDTAVIGISSRVNKEGARQLEQVLAVQGTRLIRVQIAGYRLHIDGAFVMIHHDIAIVNPTTLPFMFMEELRRLGIRLITLNHEDPSWAVNCLTIAPGRVLMSGQLSPRTQDAIDHAGIHCPTSPLMRDAV